MKKLGHLVLVGVLATWAWAGSAWSGPVADPYQEGIRDYYSGSPCYRARPYSDDPRKDALWARGFHHAQRLDHGRTRIDDSPCRGGSGQVNVERSKSKLEPTAAKNTDKFPMRILGDWCSITDGMGPQYRRGTCPKNSKVERWLKVRPDEYVGHEFGCSLVKGVTEGDVFRAQLSCGGEGQEWTQTDRFILRGEKLTIQQIEHGDHKDTEAMAPPVPESSMDRSDKPTSDADVADWKKMVVSSLERNKRYPAEALGRGESGVARIYFELDREGRVMSSRILSSSGSAMLDQEALDILRRASPFPAPPESLGPTVALTVPIRFTAATPKSSEEE